MSETLVNCILIVAIIIAIIFLVYTLFLPQIYRLHDSVLKKNIFKIMSILRMSRYPKQIGANRRTKKYITADFIEEKEIANNDTIDEYVEIQRREAEKISKGRIRSKNLLYKRIDFIFNIASFVVALIYVIVIFRKFHSTDKTVSISLISTFLIGICGTFFSMIRKISENRKLKEEIKDMQELQIEQINTINQMRENLVSDYNDEIQIANEELCFKAEQSVKRFE